jgi:hypothetical protein
MMSKETKKKNKQKNRKANKNTFHFSTVSPQALSHFQLPSSAKSPAKKSTTKEKKQKKEKKALLPWVHATEAS